MAALSVGTRGVILTIAATFTHHNNIVADNPTDKQQLQCTVNNTISYLWYR